MGRDGKHAVIYLRMSPQLRDAVRAAADSAGCSLNAFAVQVLAAAAGDPARFRVAAAATAVLAEESDLRDLERDHLGYPLGFHERFEHSAYRGEFIAVMDREIGTSAMVALVRRLDAEDPAYFVEWGRLRSAEAHADRGCEGRRGAG